MQVLYILCKIVFFAPVAPLRTLPARLVQAGVLFWRSKKDITDATLNDTKQAWFVGMPGKCCEKFSRKENHCFGYNKH